MYSCQVSLSLHPSQNWSSFSLQFVGMFKWPNRTRTLHSICMLCRHINIIFFTRSTDLSRQFNSWSNNQVLKKAWVVLQALCNARLLWFQVINTFLSIITDQQNRGDRDHISVIPSYMPVQWQQGSYTHLYDKASEKPVPVILHRCFLAHMCKLSETCNHPPVSIPLTMWTTIIVRILTHKDFAGVYIMRVTSNVYYYYYHTMPAGRHIMTHYKAIIHNVCRWNCQPFSGCLFP